ncbi:hypothetical protein [Leucobacter chinensis]|uniref:hypothetical protein n=1 Tax=Leucobacter chinensis TaxID=2851010 RepID=UPI001C2446D9|nr:hypothetical protein [Leucobacter chinensis]
MRRPFVTAFGFIAAATLLLTGCQANEAAPVVESEPEQAHGPVQGNPVVEIRQQWVQYEGRDRDGERFTLEVTLERPELNGTTDAISDALKEQVDDVLEGYFADLRTWASAYSVEELNCEDSTACALPVSITTPDHGTYETYAGATMHFTAEIVESLPSHEVFSVVVATDGSEKTPELADIVNLRDRVPHKKVLHELQAADNWQACAELEPDFDEWVAAWTPTEKGLALTWSETASRISKECGVISVVMPWGDEAPTDSADPAIEESSGTWCSGEGDCLAIDYPTLTHEGTTFTMKVSGKNGLFLGCFDIGLHDEKHAPAGYAAYCPAIAPTFEDSLSGASYETGAERLMLGDDDAGVFYSRSQ